MSEYILEMKDITKRFPGVLALDQMNVGVRRGEVHALCGENGAGKSTLIKIICGMYPYGSYEGELMIDGELQKNTTIEEAENKGVVCIQQELALVEELSIQENIYMKEPPNRHGIVQWEELYCKAKNILERVSLNVDPRTKVKHLGVGQKQLVEIARALTSNPKILILDEPTAALTDSEVEILLKIVENLRGEGVTCIYISHKLDEVFAISDTITVIRDGKKIHTAPAKELTKETLITHMVGRPLEQQFPRERHTAGEIVMEVKNLTVYDETEPTSKRADDVSLQIRKGEILGIAGLMGSGRSEMFASIFGAYAGKREGEILIRSKKVNNATPLESIKNGYCMLSEDRKLNGLNLMMNVRENATMASLEKFSRVVVNESAEIKYVQEQIDQLRIKTPTMEMQVSNLSGGNQQKVVIAKWLLAKPDILVVDEPTRGVDVGAKYEIYKILNALVDQGIAVVMISSELEEILGMSDRILVVNLGKIKGELDIQDASQETIMNCALAMD